MEWRNQNTNVLRSDCLQAAKHLFDTTCVIPAMAIALRWQPPSLEMNQTGREHSYTANTGRIRKPPRKCTPHWAIAKLIKRFASGHPVYNISEAIK